MRTRVRAAACMALALSLVGPPLASAQMSKSFTLYDFERPNQHWRLHVDGDPVGAPCALADNAARGGSSMQIPVVFPATQGAGLVFWAPKPDSPEPGGKYPQPYVDRAEGSPNHLKTGVPIGGEPDDAWRARWGRWWPFTHLSLDVRMPAEAPPNVHVMVGLKDIDLDYYQHFQADALRPGAWTHLDLDLTARSRHWSPKGHHKPWDGYCRQDIHQLDIKFTCRSAYQGRILVDNVVLHSRRQTRPVSNAIYNLRPGATTIGLYDKFELSFNLTRAYSNPFDPDVVEVVGHFYCPDGTAEAVPGFFYQGYQRRREGGAERLMAMGRSQWKVRYAPRQPGRYHYCVVVKDKNQSIRSETGTFVCAAGKNPGYVRLSKIDPDYFELDDGTFYYPIGHNIAAVRDTRAEKMGVYLSDAEGTFAYDRILSAMAAHGENFGRIWMTPWSFEIEWTKDYASHYRGLGRYSLRNAWRLDHVIDTAAEHGIYLMLLFASHGEFMRYEGNFYGPKNGGYNHIEWGSPYYSRNGGPLTDFPGRAWSAHERFYTDPTVLKFYKRQARYIAARWGYSAAIMSWEVLNEPDLAMFFREEQEARRKARKEPLVGDQCAEFVRQIILELRRNDPARHLATTGLWKHLSWHTAPVMRLEEMDFFAGHLFEPALAQKLREQYALIKRTYGKIMFVTEADFTPFPPGAELTLRRIRVPIWSSFMMPHPGTACPWWWVLIDQKDAYADFAALAAFARGEDRRGRNYAPIAASVTDEAGVGAARKLHVECLGNARRAFCWIYNAAAFEKDSLWYVEKPAAATVRVPGRADGPWIVQVWDTTKGSPVQTVNASAQGGVLTFDLPPFARDIACKLMRGHSGPARAAPPEQAHTLPY